MSGVTVATCGGLEEVLEGTAGMVFHYTVPNELDTVKIVDLLLSGHLYYSHLVGQTQTCFSKETDL